MTEEKCLYPPCTTDRRENSRYCSDSCRVQASNLRRNKTPGGRDRAEVLRARIERNQKILKKDLSELAQILK